MKKVLLITDVLEHYRVPLYNSLCEKIELTIAHKGEFKDNCLFRQIKLDSKTYGPFIKYNWDQSTRYDVIIYPFNVRCLNLLFDTIRKKPYKIAGFGIGVAASYAKLYDSKNFIQDKLRLQIAKRIDNLIFYENYPYIKYKALGINPCKMAVAYNTVQINPNFKIQDKEYKSFIFIGSLYKQKKIFDLIKCYHNLYIINNSIHNLEIIGDGDEFKNIKKYISDNNLSGKIILHGKIVDDALLLPIMKRAVVCVSPGQAGLSVQKCFSYGVGFITEYNSITGGESHSIIEGTTGNFYDGTLNDLEHKMRLYTDINYCKNISINAFNFYSSFRNVNIWKTGFLKNLV
ncbi:glycosyltransferase [Empedobacter falsenii]